MTLILQVTIKPETTGNYVYLFGLAYLLTWHTFERGPGVYLTLKCLEVPHISRLWSKSPLSNQIPCKLPIATQVVDVGCHCVESQQAVWSLSKICFI